MEKNVRVYELRAKAGQLQSELARIRKGFEGIKLPESVEKKFSELSTIIDTIYKKTDKGFVSRSSLKEIDGELRKVSTRFGSILESVDALDKLTKDEKIRLLPSDARQQLTDMNTKLVEYRKTLGALIKAENDYARAQERTSKAEVKKETASANVAAAEKTASSSPPVKSPITSTWYGGITSLSCAVGCWIP